MNRENSIEKETIKAEDITDITLIQAGYYWEMGFNEFDFTCKIKGVDDVLHMREHFYVNHWNLIYWKCRCWNYWINCRIPEQKRIFIK